VKILTIDNERLALQSLNDAILNVEPDAELSSYRKVSEALKAVEQEGYRPEAAFMDIEMPGMTGIELAGRIKKASPGTWIIFVTGFSSYALDAFSVHASGYIMKPVTPERIREEPDHIGVVSNLQTSQDQRLQVRCFGNFEVLKNGTPVQFSKKKAKELFAYLVHKRGTSCTTRELAAVMFEDAPYDLTHQSYLQTIIANMCHMLKDIDEEAVIVRTFGAIAIDPSRIDCDYYRFLEMDPAAVNAYAGEYMSQYEWGEFTVGILDQKQ
jgi:two-component SAPR family response regulator